MEKLEIFILKLSRSLKKLPEKWFPQLLTYYLLILHFSHFQTPFSVNILMAGYDDENKECEMYVLDYLASMVKAPFAAHGYGGFFTTSIMDREYRKDMSETEAYELMKACVKEVHKRLIINLPNFQVQVVDKEGIKNLDDITIKNLKWETYFFTYVF